MRLAALWSGGKDSSYAAFLSMEEGHRIKYLVTMFPEQQDSWMFHWPAVELTKLQAEAVGIKQITQKTKGEKEKELEDLKRVLEKIKNEIDGVVSGAVASQYQKSRIDKICKGLGLESIAPLWQKSPGQLLREEIDSGFEIIIVGVFAEGFDKSWLGRKIDDKCFEDLIELSKKYGISCVAEGGEFETLVTNCPIFKKKIQMEDSKIIWDNKTSSGYLIVGNARLIEKV
jgi:ABC transporter with metal-binding/Fe-S-binding domain ATP-binding protein